MSLLLFVSRNIKRIGLLCYASNCDNGIDSEIANNGKLRLLMTLFIQLKADL